MAPAILTIGYERYREPGGLVAALQAADVGFRPRV